METENYKKKLLDSMGEAESKAQFEKMLRKAKTRMNKVLHPFINRPTGLPLTQMLNKAAPPLKKSGKNRSQEVQSARNWHNKRNRNRIKQGKKPIEL